MRRFPSGKTPLFSSLARRFWWGCSAALLLGGFSGLPTKALAGPQKAPEILIDVDQQKLRVVKGGMAVASFPISTSRFGLGDTFHSYKTPVGTFKVSGKTGGELPLGAVLKGGRFTGEILPVNAPGRDPIVTRIIHLQGLETQNRNALSRGILIHGTPEEKQIGKPVSWGCIRMRSRDVVELYKQVDVGTKVIISTQKGSIQTSAEKSKPWIVSWFQ
jgi:lipoprotein-anchoring transpeptidase ErfK/SrfK